jgi:hypothetical protein
MCVKCVTSLSVTLGLLLEKLEFGLCFQLETLLFLGKFYLIVIFFSLDNFC